MYTVIVQEKKEYWVISSCSDIVSINDSLNIPKQDELETFLKKEKQKFRTVGINLLVDKNDDYDLFKKVQNFYGKGITVTPF